METLSVTFSQFMASSHDSVLIIFSNFWQLFGFLGPLAGASSGGRNEPRYHSKTYSLEALFSATRPEFLTLGSVDIWHWMVLYPGGCPVHCMKLSPVLQPKCLLTLTDIL